MRKIWILAYVDSMHLDLQIIYYSLLTGLVFLLSQFSDLWWLYFLYFGICVLWLQSECFIRFDRQGVSVCSAFIKPFHVSWDEITHWGMTTQTYKHGPEQVYMYLATAPFLKAPWEKMPRQNRNFIYLTYSVRIRNALIQVGRKTIPLGLSSMVVHGVSKNNRRRILGCAICVLFCIVTMTWYLVRINVSLLPWFLFPSLYVILVFLLALSCVLE